MSSLVVVASIKSKPEKAEALRHALTSLLAPTRAENGCIRYELNQSDDGRSWVFVEQWESRTLWERHMESRHLSRFKGAMDELVETFEVFVGNEVHIDS